MIICSAHNTYDNFTIYGGPIECNESFIREYLKLCQCVEASLRPMQNELDKFKFPYTFSLHT